MRLEGKIAVIVGAGQSPGEGLGNGRATTLRFAQEGARILAVDRTDVIAAETGSPWADGRQWGRGGVRSGLAAGGKWIRTLGPTCGSGALRDDVTRSDRAGLAASLRSVVAHPTVEQHAQRSDEAERLV